MPLCGGDFQSKLDLCTQSRTRRCFEKFFLSFALADGDIVKLKCCSMQLLSFFGGGKIFKKEEPVETREAGALWVQQQS